MFHLLFGFISVAFLLRLIPFIFFHPSNDRDWSIDQMILPYGEINANLVHLKNIRNFSYITSHEYIPDYYDKTFNLNKLRTVDFIVEPFDRTGLAAHTFLSFGFDNDEFVSISIEIRKKKGDSFSPLRGLFRQYEIMYVISDERDVVKLRVKYRKDPVYIYPVKFMEPEKLRLLFLSMIKRANELRKTPEFYNTLNNTCMTNIVRHFNEVADKKVFFSFKILLPGFSDKLAYQLGLIDTNLPLKKIREHFYINNRAMKYADSPDFSKLIRQYDEKL
ncbi:MAG: DUF4105 domain-containing protein [Spirochaetia bacterium]|nr:DUF4105 domain-containing protein [Spirochaetia bacterium]